MVTEAPEQATTAEEGVLGCCLSSREALRQARLTVTADVFWQPRNALMFEIICGLDDQDVTPEPRAVVAELIRRKQTRQLDPMHVFDVWQGCLWAGNVDYYARQVREAARVRAVTAAHDRLGQALESARESGDHDALLDMAASQSIALQLLAEQTVEEEPVDGLSTWDRFVESDAAEDWLVAGLLRRHDVVMILAAAGAGKSFLSRQICTAIAAGVHPFTLHRIPPRRTLLVDLENAPGQVAEESAPLLDQVKRLGDWVEDRGWVWMRTEGLNLRQRRDAQLFERVIAETRPEVVAFGSLYNAYSRGSDGWDTAAEEVQDVLKRLRKKYGLAFWLEHHMPVASGGGHTGTPFGGTSWMRWPTHGRVLKRVGGRNPLYALERDTFRGDRGKREIPVGLQRGGRLPWTAIFDEDEFEILREASQ